MRCAAFLSNAESNRPAFPSVAGDAILNRTAMNEKMSLPVQPARIALLFLLSLAQVQTEAPAATLSVSPSVISNSYPGVIQLNIGGLTNGEQVVVRKWLDLNANGSIDSGEPVIDMFKIADGG